MYVSVHWACRCAVYVQDICSIISHIISRATQAGGQSQAAMQTSSSGTSCVLAGLPHSVYNMVSTSAPACQLVDADDTSLRLAVAQPLVR